MYKIKEKLKNIGYKELDTEPSIFREMAYEIKINNASYPCTEYIFTQLQHMVKEHNLEPNDVITFNINNREEICGVSVTEVLLSKCMEGKKNAKPIELANEIE